MKKILIIIPAYNEGKNLVSLIKKINSINKDWNILIIDDSKDDNTSNLIYKSNLFNFKYINRKEKKGRGNAVRQGFDFTVGKNFEYILEMDADLSHDPEEIIILLEKIIKSKCDLVIGSRYANESKIIGWSIKRRIFSKLANILARGLFGFKVTDYTNGFRIYSQKAIQEIIRYKMKNHGFIYLTETLNILRKKNYSISEIPTIFVNRKFGKSSLTIGEIFNSLIGIIKLRFTKNELLSSNN